MKRPAKVLVVEDDPATSEIVKVYLEHEGYRVMLADNGATGLEIALRDAPDMIVLDVMLPALDGLDLCRRLRASSDAPVIMVTARSTEDDKIAGLDAGADDYVTKPFSPRELVARIQAVLRRGDFGVKRRRVFSFEGLVVDAGAREVFVDGSAVALTRTEFDLLETLCRSPGIALSRAQLVERSFGFDYEGAERTVDAHIAKLRKKIAREGTKSEFVQTVLGVGYKLAAAAIDA